MCQLKLICAVTSYFGVYRIYIAEYIALELFVIKKRRTTCKYVFSITVLLMLKIMSIHSYKLVWPTQIICRVVIESV